MGSKFKTEMEKNADVLDDTALLLQQRKQAGLWDTQVGVGMAGFELEE